MWLWATTLATFLSLSGSSTLDGANVQRQSVGTGAVIRHVQSWHWAQDILQAVMMMNSVSDKDWMADSEQCAAAVKNTLDKLAHEYTDLQVGTVLSSACDHMNVYLDFGGHTNACRPVFGDLAEEFDGGKDYATWCEQAASMLAADKVEHHVTKKEMVEEAKAELAEAEAKHAKGEDIQEDLGKVKEIVNEAEDEQDKDEDVKVGKAQFGHGEGKGVDSKAPPKEAPSKGALSDGKIYPGVAPFGNKPKADTLTSGSKSETNAMIDQIEKAQAAEEKRSAFRALTRLRGAMTTSYDAMAGKHMQNIDEWNAKHSWRKENKVKHLASEEADTSKWAYPGNEPSNEPSKGKDKKSKGKDKKNVIKDD